MNESTTLSGMGKKQLFTTDYEMHASAKLLYPYIQTASGLAQWFATNVNINAEKIFTFIWEQEQKKAAMHSFRMNHYVKFEFLSDTGTALNDPSWFEIRLETDEMTQLTYLKVSDYSDFDDMEELQEIWDDLIDRLKSVVGG
jgi:uncharacterized protein YndB with AHSA1/START domain